MTQNAEVNGTANGRVMFVLFYGQCLLILYELLGNLKLLGTYTKVVGEHGST